MKPQKRQRASKSRLRLSFLKRSSRDSKNFSARAWLRLRIWIAPAQHETRTSGDLLKQTGVSTRKNRRHRNLVWFTTRYFARVNGFRQESRWLCFYRRKTSKYARLCLKRRSAQSIMGIPCA